MNMLDIKIFFANIFYFPVIYVLEYLNLKEETIALFSALIVIDMVTGVWKVLSLGEKPKSWRFANGLLSKAILLLVPLSVAIAAKAIEIDLSQLVRLFIYALVLSELYSIIANIYSIRTKKEAEEFDVLSLLLRYIRNALNRALQDNKTKEK